MFPLALKADIRSFTAAHDKSVSDPKGQTRSFTFCVVRVLDPEGLAPLFHFFEAAIVRRSRRRSGCSKGINWPERDYDGALAVKLPATEPTR